MTNWPLQNIMWGSKSVLSGYQLHHQTHLISRSFFVFPQVFVRHDILAHIGKVKSARWWCRAWEEPLAWGTQPHLRTHSSRSSLGFRLGLEFWVSWDLKNLFARFKPYGYLNWKPGCPEKLIELTHPQNSSNCTCVCLVVLSRFFLESLTLPHVARHSPCVYCLAGEHWTNGLFIFM